MSYFSLVLLNLSRAFFRRNRTISSLNFVIVVLLLATWSALMWFIKSQYQDVAVLQLTVLFQLVLICSLSVFAHNSSVWQHYLSKQTNSWLGATGPITVGTIISLSTIIPFYLAYVQASSLALLTLRTLSLILFSLAVSILAAAIGVVVRKSAAPGLLRIVMFCFFVVGAYLATTADTTAILSAGLQNTSINLTIIVSLFCVGLFGFAIAFFDWISIFPDRVRHYKQYSGLFKSFRVFGINSDQANVQFTNSLLRWLRSGALQYRIGSLLVILYLVSLLYLRTDIIDERGTILIYGALITTLVASASFNAVAQSRLHLYHWLPLTSTATILTNWLAGIVTYSLLLAIIYWFSPFLSLITIGVIALTVLVVHTLSTAITYRLSQDHQHYTDRSIQIVIGGGLFGIIPGTFFQIVPNDITVATLGIWLLVTLLFFRMVSRTKQLQAN